MNSTNTANTTPPRVHPGLTPAGYLCLGLIALVQAGCASLTGDQSPIPRDGPPMIDIYRRATTGDTETAESAASNADSAATSTAQASQSAGACGSPVTQDNEDGDEDDYFSGFDYPVIPRCGNTTKPFTPARDLSTTQYDQLPTTDQPPVLHDTYTRNAENEIKSLFPRLPNPDINIYMYPHLSTRNRVPVPGYTTVIPLYERVQYALPGEAQALPD